MARTKIIVDKLALQLAVTEAEKRNGGPFATRKDLYTAAAAVYSESGTIISASLVNSRFVEFNLVAQTPKGKRGRPKGVNTKSATPVATSMAAVTPLGEVADGGDEADLDVEPAAVDLENRD